jgi:hypothetical protein
MRKLRYLVLIVVVLLLVGWALYSAAERSRGKPRFTIGKDTTYVEGPVDEAGFIDYAAALNERLKEGVTPENNANVLLWQAFGPHPEGATMPPQFFKLMGTEPPPEEEDYYVPLHKYLSKERPQSDTGELADLLERARKRLWSAADYPELHTWIALNDAPLRLVIDASKRPRYFLPLVPPPTDKGRESLLNARLPTVQLCREAAYALAARAMWQAAEGKHDQAWQDLLAAHRLGRLIAQGGTFIETLVGVAIDGVASTADLALLEAKTVSANQLKKYLRDLEALPPMPPVAEKVTLGERFMLLDLIMMTNRHGFAFLEGISNGRTDDSSPLMDMVLFNVNWDPALRNANRWVERVRAAANADSRRARKEQLDTLEQDIEALKAKTMNVKTDTWRLLVSGEAKGEWIGNMLICLTMSALRKVNDAVDRHEQTHRNLQVAFALAAYRNEHGRYPAKLEDLSPGYLARIPTDLFSDKPLIYVLQDDGYILYSVGVNGQDEEGRGTDDDPRGDDLAVRMPLPPLKAK